MKEILFGAAYYDEYMPCERLREDIQMMKKAGINTVRIAESTWSTCEPQEGVFDFLHVEKVMDAMEEAGIHVIIGTPTYAHAFLLSHNALFRYPPDSQLHSFCGRYTSSIPGLLFLHKTGKPDA